MINYSNVLIMGYGRSGNAVEKVLKIENINYKIYDKNNKNFIHKLKKKFIKNFDLIVVSPGISIYNKWVQYALKRKINVISELEFGFIHLDKSIKLIAVTGTNGKTTTVKLINDFLVSEGFKSEAVGNIGKPLSAVVFEKYDYLVCEVSSFQLELIKSFKPDIAIILNIAEDHLDRHKNLENYANAKISLLKNKPEISILNYDDELIQKNTKNIPSDKKIFFSHYDIFNGIFIDQHNQISINENGSQIKNFHLKKLEICNVFIEDVMATLALAYYLKLNMQSIYKLSKSYYKIANKCEIMTNTYNVMTINDSKATNIHAMQTTLKMCKNPTVLLLGGYDKKLNFNNFFSCINTYNIKEIIAFGNVKNRIYRSAKKYNFKRIILVKNLCMAIQKSIEILDKKDILLFSPACSSFDEFNGYEERGEFFKKKYYELIGSKYENKK